jgi:cytoskeletal protein CcmA (bactofilin family)
MWKREEAAKPVSPAAMSTVAGARPAARADDRDVVNIGRSVVVQGELSGSEDLTINGQVEGKIELLQHQLTIGLHGRIRADVFAKVVVVLGEVVGNVTATEMVSILDSGVVDGDITAPKVAIAEGAKFRGGIDMQQGGKSKNEVKAEPEPKPKSKAQPEKQVGNQTATSPGRS